MAWWVGGWGGFPHSYALTIKLEGNTPIMDCVCLCVSRSGAVLVSLTDCRSSSTGSALKPQKKRKTKAELWNISRMKGVVTPLCHP